MKSGFDRVCQSIGPYGLKLKSVSDSIKDGTQEIRLHTFCKPIVRKKGRIVRLEEFSTLSREEMDDIVESICDHSIYAHQNEMSEGFITLEGGHRVGICGTAVYSDDKITYIRDVTSVNIRIAEEHPFSENILIEMLKKRPFGVLIAGEPLCGKTTLLREIAAILSNDGYCVTVADERNEICAAVNGIVQYQSIELCDVLSYYKKVDAVSRAVRTLSPDVIICDELGSSDEVMMLNECLNCGVPVIASVHAANVRELLSRTSIVCMLETGAFTKIAVMSGKNEPGKIDKVIDIKEVLDEYCCGTHDDRVINIDRYGNALGYSQKM